VSKKWNIKIGSIYDMLDENFGTETDDDEDDVNLQKIFRNKPINVEMLQ
jgi:hypothetical protein